MTLSLLKSLHHHHHHRCTLALSAAAAIRHDTTLYTLSPLIKVFPAPAPAPAAESLFHISVDVSHSPELSTSYTKPGQYLQLRLTNSVVTRPTFLAIVSPPSVAASRGVFEFLIKSIPRSVAELLCGLRKGDVVELSPAMGNGFQIDRISPPEEYQTVLIFATGFGISPIRSLIEAGFSADKRRDVRLYYGARNLDRMAYQERFKDWEFSGVDIVPVLSEPKDGWTGEQGYVQAAFSRAKRILCPRSTGAVFCGHKLMAEEVTSILIADIVSREKILKNF